MKTPIFLLSLIFGCVYVNATTPQIEEPESNQTPYEEEPEVDEEYFYEYFPKKYEYFLPPAAVVHGDTVAFQPVYNKLYWLGCPSKKCDRKTCPRLYMEGNDWYNCWGEVFQIFRKEGPGVVYVGDTVGIFYPREKKWLSLAGGVGHKASCPGYINKYYGFYSYDKWEKCWGEVFEIYARGKAQGAIINEHDHITLYYKRKNLWVGLVNDHPVDLRTCPGKARPPPDDKYDRCWGEVFELWKKPY